MKKLTSISYFELPEGLNEAITYSEIDDNGQIVSKNQKASRIVTDEDEATSIRALIGMAQARLS